MSYLDEQHEKLRFLDEDGNFVRDDYPEIPDEDLLTLFKTILRIRVLEDRMIKLQRQGRIGFYIGTIGEEATHVGATYALKSSDLIFPAYREVGPALMRGFDLQEFVDQLFGNEADVCKGRQMPNHHSARPLNLASISSPVGTQIPQCTGTGWAAKVRGSDQVSLCFFGDGTTSEGDFHVGLNFAGVAKAPAIFFIRNNGWAISEPTSAQTATETLHVKARAYGIPGVRVDGNDVFAVVHAVRAAAERARKGEGATLIEGVTYRIGGHSTSDDPSQYRDESDVAKWEHADPMNRLRKLLHRKDLINDTVEEQVKKEMSAEVIAAVKIAEAKSKPPLSSMFDDVFAGELPWHLERQRRELLELYKGT